MSKPTIGIIGLSHLGVTWSVGYAALGFPVVAYDSDAQPVTMLQRGTLPIPEPGMPEQFAAARERLRCTSEPQALRECPVVFFAKDVPYDEEGRIDLTEIDQLLDAAIPHLAPNVEFVFMGQVPVGYTRTLEARIRRMRSGMPFTLVYRVETLTISQAVHDFLHPDRVIVGCSSVEQALSSTLRAVMVAPFGDPPVARCSFESAEMAKSAINIYLANAVTFVNVIADLCEHVGANIQEVVGAMKMDKRFSPYCYWRPGLGFAGGHLERDLMSLSKLAEEHQVDARFFHGIVQNSTSRYQWLVRHIENLVCAEVKEPTLGVWGLAYKKGTDSLHNAHCLKVFRDYGSRARFRVYDPVAKLPNALPGVEVCRDKFEALQGADGLLILTEWEEFMTNDPRPFVERMRRPVVIDGVQVCGEEIRRSPRLTYAAMGIPLGYGQRTA